MGETADSSSPQHLPCVYFYTAPPAKCIKLNLYKLSCELSIQIFGTKRGVSWDPTSESVSSTDLCQPPGCATAYRCHGTPPVSESPAMWVVDHLAETFRSAGMEPGTALCNFLTRS